jgi:hypothetical protein
VRTDTSIQNPTPIANPPPDNPTASTDRTPEANRDRVATPMMKRVAARGSRYTGRFIAAPFSSARLLEALARCEWAITD